MARVEGRGRGRRGEAELMARGEGRGGGRRGGLTNKALKSTLANEIRDRFVGGC